MIGILVGGIDLNRQESRDLSDQPWVADVCADVAYSDFRGETCAYSTVPVLLQVVAGSSDPSRRPMLYSTSVR